MANWTEWDSLMCNFENGVIDSAHDRYINQKAELAELKKYMDEVKQWSDKILLWTIKQKKYTNY